MADKEIISSSQYTWSIFSIVTSVTALQLPTGLLISLAGQDSWLSVVVAWFLDVLVAILFAYMATRFPGKSFNQYSETILGRYAGKLIGVIYSTFFLMVAVLFMRALAEMVFNMFLPKTPIEFILATAFITVAYGIRKGIETIARAGEILGPIYLISMVVLLFLVYREVSIERLKPQLAEGYSPFITGGIFVLTFFGVCIVMGMYIPLVNKQKNGFISKFTAVTMAAPIFCLIVAFCIGIFGDGAARSLINPGLSLVRYISIGRTFIRVEIIWMTIVIAAGIVTSASLIWAFCKGISDTAKLTSYKPLAYPAVICAFVLSITSFTDYIDLNNFILFAFPIMALFVELVLVLFLLAMALILKKRGS